MKKQGSGVRGQGSEKTQNQPPITAQTVSDALAKLGGAGAAAVADHLQAQTYKERSLVRKVLSSLLQAGGVKAVRQQGVVTYHLNGKPGRGSVQAKLWEFACLRFATAKPFTAAEAARLAECDLDYTKRYYRFLWGAAYLAIITRGRAGALLYQLVGGKEHEAAPAWNRRAEKRKRCAGETPAPPDACATAPPAGQGSGVRGQEEAGAVTLPPFILPARETNEAFPDCLYFRHCGLIMGKNPRPGAAGITGARERLDAALEDFGRALVAVAGGIDRAWEIIREMKGELFTLAAEEQGHDEPEKPTEGHH